MPPIPTAPVRVAEPGEPAEPHRPLGRHGRELWDRCQPMPWIKASDSELLLMTCEQLDERQQLRFLVLTEGGRFERGALRAIERQIQQSLSILGFNPESRERLGAHAVPEAPDQLATLRAARDIGS